jgi:SAM-dependent methyltransferase
MKLNVGSGNRPKEGYLSVDLVGGDVTAPAWDLPYGDGTVEAIYSRHMIEHLTFKNAHRALAEWSRVLVPGGTVEIICPNRDIHVANLGDHRINPKLGISFHDFAMNGLYGWQRKRPHDVHQWAWNPGELGQAMQDAGFTVTKYIQTVPEDCHILGVK